MIVFLTTADTEVLATVTATQALPDGFAPVRALNPASAGDAVALVDELMDARPGAVLVRLLGGRRAWADGFDRLTRRCRAEGVALLAFGGEAAPDAELTAASTAPKGVVAEAFEYLLQGGVANTEQLLRFVSDTVLRTGFGFEPPQPLPAEGLWQPSDGDRQTSSRAAPDDLDTTRPTIGVVFYRTHWMSGNTGFVATLVDQIEAAGANALPVFCYSLRPPAPGGGGPGAVAALDLLAGKVDAIVVTVLAMGGSNAGSRGAGDGADPDWWSVPALEQLDVPVVQAVCATSTRAAWEASGTGLSPLDAAMQVAIPEFDGRIVAVPLSFKETVEGPGAGEGGVPRYVADPERAARVAGIAVRLARLRRTPNARKKVAIVLSNYPTRHGRVGNAVGRDTPASAVRLLDALTAAGYDTGDWATSPRWPGRGLAEDGDRLVHALIAAGGHDPEFVTAEQLAANPARVPAARYAQWFARLPPALRGDLEAHWGPPPGRVSVDDARGDADLVVAGLELGNVFLAIQPPRGFGENPVAIYHDPDLAPTHHYLATYRWLDEQWRADAVVHLGKHGTLEWLPGKGLGLSAACAPDAVLGDLPLLYPFVVNDPGEGTQAKRRAHAVIVDHLVPPMTRAETYDELARLEQLLDEYYQVQTLDPAKLPAIRGRIWELLRACELHRDLGVDAPPEDFDDFLVHVDGYLCEIKDLQIRGGLHVLGQAPLAEDRIGLVLAILRLPQAGGPGTPGLRAAIGAAYGLDEAELLAEPG
ncbi:MAG: cobaltochelatase subunit CobN, partial [Actinomycetota bacterium]|nr:cobaltochelatase subunit CobN [Actinomycetota bacterium]